MAMWHNYTMDGWWLHASSYDVSTYYILYCCDDVCLFFGGRGISNFELSQRDKLISPKPKPNSPHFLHAVDYLKRMSVSPHYLLLERDSIRKKSCPLNPMFALIN
eukprot:scaffold619_cov150-Skeletonema_menzelii.AAC.10